MFQVTTENGFIVNQSAVNLYQNASALIQAQAALCSQPMNTQECLNLGKVEPINRMIKELFDVSPTWHKHFDVDFKARSITLGIPKKHVYADGGENKKMKEPFDVQFTCSSDIGDRETACYIWALRQSKTGVLLDPIYRIQQKQDKSWEETTLIGKVETFSVQANNPIHGIELIKTIAPTKKDLVPLLFLEAMEVKLIAFTLCVAPLLLPCWSLQHRIRLLGL